MSNSEFCKEIAPTVLELQYECSKLTEKGFVEFRESVLQESNGIVQTFMKMVLDDIHHSLLEKGVWA